jgi:hypothetical protein
VLEVTLWVNNPGMLSPSTSRHTKIAEGDINFGQLRL